MLVGTAFVGIITTDSLAAGTVATSDLPAGGRHSTVSILPAGTAFATRKCRIVLRDSFPSHTFCNLTAGTTATGDLPTCGCHSTRRQLARRCYVRCKNV
ncbi:hypothetical protein B296_00010250 [Ensete ventricosum]|uniref:Secreted protein n=1 Tax=Ensete ventricosum TaxID=4639 RepID=A0A427AQA2_ENSVE|nr:hypothetical protein B296_00010250 [Ensete ventricosum]